MRELRGEMERLRGEREEWEAEAGRERERREEAEEELRAIEWREREGRKEWEEGRDQLERERERADNLQEVLGEVQAGQLERSFREPLADEGSKGIRTTTSHIGTRDSAPCSCNFPIRIQTTRSERRDEAG
jgi:hypothetical protein